MEKRLFDLLKKCFKRTKMDFIVEQYQQDFWTVRKWNSGIMEMWGTWNGNLNHYSTLKNLPLAPYAYTNYFDLPEPFVNDNYSKTAAAQVGTGYSIPISGRLNDGPGKVCFHWASNVGDTNAACRVNFQLKGLWKEYSAGSQSL